MEKRWLKTSLTVSIIVVLVLLLYLVNYLFSNDEFDNSKNADDKIIENNIKLNENSIEALLDSYVNSFNNNCCNISSLYKSKMYFKNIDSNIKLTTILNIYLNKNSIDTSEYKLNDQQVVNIKEMYRNIFNENINLNKVSGNCPKIIKSKDRYYLDNCKCDNKDKVVLHFKRSVEDEKSIKLYYKVAFYTQRSYLGNNKDVISKDPRGVYEVYKKAITNKEFNYQEYLDNNLDKFDEYEFTFKKINDNYYFYSMTMN